VENPPRSQSLERFVAALAASSRLEAAALDRPAGPLGLSEHAGAKGLPQGHHPFELGEHRSGAGQHEVFRPGLGRQQTINRISVRQGPQAGLSSSFISPSAPVRRWAGARRTPHPPFPAGSRAAGAGWDPGAPAGRWVCHGETARWARRRQPWPAGPKDGSSPWSGRSGQTGGARLRLNTHAFLWAISHPALREPIERVGKLLHRRDPGGPLEPAALASGLGRTPGVQLPVPSADAP